MINSVRSRLCAKSVCGDCSKKKIKGNRVGDICYMKNTNQKMEIQKKHYLKSLGNWIKDLDQKITKLERTIAEKEIKKDKLVGEIKSGNREM